MALMPGVAVITNFSAVTGNQATVEACSPLHSWWCQLRRGVFYTWTDNFGWSSWTS